MFNLLNSSFCSFLPLFFGRLKKLDFVIKKNAWNFVWIKTRGIIQEFQVLVFTQTKLELRFLLNLASRRANFSGGCSAAPRHRRTRTELEVGRTGQVGSGPCCGII